MLHYRLLAGAQVQPQAPTLLVFHGLFGISDNWQTVGKMLGEHYPTYLVDMRNHGRSPRYPSMSYTDMAADMAELAQSLGLDNAVFIGHSMGGKAVMQLAANYPQLCQKLVVIDIAPRYYPLHHQRILEGLNAINLATLTSRNQAEATLAQYVPQTDTRQFLLKNLYRAEQGGFDWRINLPVLTREIAQVGEALHAQGPIAIPTLFVRGGHSDYITDADWQAILPIFPQAQLATVAGAGHWVHAEKPMELFALLRQFLGR